MGHSGPHCLCMKLSLIFFLVNLSCFCCFDDNGGPGNEAKLLFFFFFPVFIELFSWLNMGLRGSKFIIYRRPQNFVIIWCA